MSENSWEQCYEDILMEFVLDLIIECFQAQLELEFPDDHMGAAIAVLWALIPGYLQPADEGRDHMQEAQGEPANGA